MTAAVTTLTIAALICFLLDTVRIPTVVNCTALGLALLTIAYLI